MYKRMMKSGLTALLLTVSLLYPMPLLADPAAVPGSVPTDKQTSEILEKSLSIVEIDREIGKIVDQQQITEASIRQITGDLQQKEQEIKVSRDRAGQRLKAYYMGEREDLLGALLSVSSFKDFLKVADYIGIILERDQAVIGDYKKQYNGLKEEQAKFEALNANLEHTKAELLNQRQRVLALQEDVNRSVQSSDNPDMLLQMIKELGDYWNNTGLKEVRKYFNALDKAMKDFPDYLKDNGGSLSSNGLNYTLVIKEADLNRFLRSKNKLFNNFSFSFAEDKVTAKGQEGDLSLEVIGHYSITDSPQNAILFHVDELIFNGLALPDTTAKELEQDFDLGFYPQEIMPLIKASSVSVEQGTMTVKLKLAL